MQALWVAPPAVLIAGSITACYQAHRIAAERSHLADAAHQLESDRNGLGRLEEATAKARASLEGLEHR